MEAETMQEIIPRLVNTEKNITAEQLYKKIESEARKTLHNLLDKHKLSVTLDWKLVPHK